MGSMPTAHFTVTNTIHECLFDSCEAVPEIPDQYQPCSHHWSDTTMSQDPAECHLSSGGSQQQRKGTCRLRLGPEILATLCTADTE